MLQVHSLLWHYLWVAPNVYLFLLGILLWRRRQYQRAPAFVAFALIGSVTELALYAADVLPSVKPEVFWLVDWANLLIEGSLKFLVIAEIFDHVFGRYSSIARVGKNLIRGVAVIVVLLATFAAAYAPRDGAFGIVSGANFLEQTIYIIECGLLVFIFLFSVYFHLFWDRMALGITLGLSVSACVHLAVWAVLVNAGLSNAARSSFVFLKMATYHGCVLLWFYYLAFPRHETASKSRPTLPESDLAVWNRELERLLQ